MISFFPRLVSLLFSRAVRSAFRLWFLAPCALLLALSAQAQPVIGVPSTSISFAQPGRTAMDVGGAWSGSADVTTTTGDTFNAIYTNSGSATAFDFTASVLLPPGFLYVAGSAQVVTVPATPGLTVSATQIGQLLTFNLSPAGFDLPAGSVITFNYGLVTDITVISSTPQLRYNRNFSLTNEGPLVGPGTDGQQNVLVRAGDSIINVNPTQQTRAVGETAVFFVTVTSSGLGGIFDVTIDESAINPGGNLQLISITQLTPSPTPVAVPIPGGLSLPYLPSDQIFVARVEALVVGCGNTQNVVSTTHRGNLTPSTSSAAVQLIILQPNISYIPPPVALDYNAPVLVSFPIQNTGLGVALNFNLQSTLHTGPGRTVALTPAALLDGWTYNPANGLFSNGANLLPGDILSLSYTVEITNPCTASGVGSVTYTPSFTNGCGLALSLPRRSHSLAPAPNTPNLSLTKSVSSSNIPYNDSGVYTLTLSAANLANFAPGPITVTDVLPAEIIYLGNTASVGTVNVTGQTVTWTLDVADLAVARTLGIDFAVVNDPCLAGEIISNTASTSVAVSSRGCNLSATSSASFFVPTNPGPSSSQSIVHTGSSPYETGVADAVPLGIKNFSEGDVIPLRATYTFAPAYLGQWVGSTYTDNFGGVSQSVLDPASLTVTGTFGTLAVPPGSVTLPLAGGIAIDLGFLAGPGFFNTPGVEGLTFRLNYSLTVPDAAITSGASRGIGHRAVLNLDDGIGGPTTCLVDSNNLFIQSIGYTVRRASAQLGLTFPAAIDICDSGEVLTITVSNVNSLQARNPFVTLLNVGSDYDFDPAFAPIYGGIFSAGNITYTPNGGNDPTFEFTGNPSANNPLTGNGTIQVRISRKPIPNTIPGPISARVNYDSWQTAPAVARVYQNSSSFTPSSVRRATLNLTVSPASIAVTRSNVSYGINVFNSDSGTGFGSVVTSTIPLGFTVNVANTNAANPYPVSVSAGPGGREVATWSVGDVASNASRNLQLFLDVGAVPGCSVSIDPAIERIQAAWGCDITPFATSTASHPSFTFPSGRIQVLHDATQTVARLCSPGKVIISIKNTGPTSVRGLIIQEIISDPSVIFIAGGPNPVRYRLNNGPLLNLVSPTVGAGSAGNPYRWTVAQIPELAELVPVGSPGVNLISIELDLNSTEALALGSPQMFASGEAVLTCGAPVISPAQPFTIPVELPSVSVAKTGRNLSANDVAFTETVYGGLNDVVEWRLIVSNTGNAAAQNLRLSDELTGSGGSAVVNGPGLAANTPFTPGLVVALSDLAATSSATYVITEILGSTCVTGNRNADISWGCSNNGPAVRSNIITPGAPIDGATIQMSPSVVGGTHLTQTVTPLDGGRARVRVTITNNGGTLYNPLITPTLPGYALHDTTGPVAIVAATTGITSVSRTGGTDAAPVFTFTGPGAPVLLRFGQSISFDYHVRPTTTDTTEAATVAELFSAESAPALDPAFPAPANIDTLLEFTNSCGAGFSSSLAASLPLLYPDLDITATTPGASVVSNSSPANYTFTVTNTGLVGSIANFIQVDFPGLGSSWTVNSITLTTPGTGGSGGTIPVNGLTPFTTAQVGTLARNQFAVITVNAQYSGTPGPLTLRLRARGEARGQDGTTLFGNYSLDQRAQRIIGVALTKALLSTSEPDSTGTNVLLGEEATFGLRALFFGAEADVTNLIIQDTPGTALPAGLSYISHTLPAINRIIPTSTSIPTPAATQPTIAASRFSFSRSTLTVADINTGTGDLFAADVVVRALNIAGNTDARNLTNNVGISFTYLGTSFASNNANDGLSGTVSSAALHANSTVVAVRPAPVIAKTSRNITRASAFAPTNTPAQAGDVIEYRLVITNPVAAPRPLYDLTVTDTVPAKLNLSAAFAGADTNGTPDSIEVLNTSGTSGLGATLTFNQTNTPVLIAGANFSRLDAGQTIVLLYRGTVDTTVNPGEVLTNAAALRGYSLPLPSGAQTAPLGTENTESGPTRYDRNTSATVVVDRIVQTKTLNDTSDPTSVGSAVFVGEQLRYRITLQIPQGTVPALTVTDSLPRGLALLATPAITIGAGISGGQPTISPTNLPADGNPLTITWNFGARTTTGANIADRTITIDYVTQVRNISGNAAGTALVNNATYAFSGAPVNLNQITVTVQTPNVSAIREGLRNITRNAGGPFVLFANNNTINSPDAGDIIEFGMIVTNLSATNRSGGFDLNLTDTLPAGLTYVAGSATVVTATGITGPAGALAPGALAPDIAGQVLTWGRSQAAPINLDIAPGGNLTLRYRATVDNTARPVEAYRNGVVVDWTTLNGDPAVNPILAPDNIALAAPGAILGERNGNVGSPNGLRSVLLSVNITTRNLNTLVKAKSADTLPRTAADALGTSPSGFRIGDLITYTVTATLQEGTLNAYQIRDTLPTGLAYFDTVSLTPAPNGGTPTPAEPFAYTTPVAGTTAPATGATGSLIWSFGSVVNNGDNLAPANDTLVLVYRARVVPTAAPIGRALTPADQFVQNSATSAYLNGAAAPTTLTTPPVFATIFARQPILTITKDVLIPAAVTINGVTDLRLRRPGDTSSFRLTVTNTGTAPAYNIRLTDTLPAGLRITAPVVTAATLNGTPDLAGLSAIATWDNTTGTWVFNLTDAQLLLPGQTFVLTYTVTVDADNALRGTTLANSATVNQFFSLPAADPQAAFRRQYAALTPVTRSLIIGLRIDGSVYHDLQPDNAKNVGEEWSGVTKPTVFANLVAPNNTVVRTVTVAPGTGLFAFDYLPPGNYTIIVTNSAAGLTAQRPANWLFQFPTTGSIATILSSATGDLINQDLGLNQGSLAAVAIAKTKSGDTLPTAAPLAGFRIGDLVTYTVAVNPQEGALTGFSVTDVLPAGLAFDSIVSITPATGGRYTYATPTGGNTPAAGATGTITWTFGNFINAISGPVTNAPPAAIAVANRFVITYRARVRNDAMVTNPTVVPIAVPAISPATTTTPSLINSANVGYTKPAPDAGAKTAGPATATIQVEQPRLTIAKTRLLPLTPLDRVVAGGPARFEVTVTNDGTAPAYNARITDTLPTGMRGTAPSAFSATLNAAAATLTPAWTPATGTYVINLSNTQLIQPGQSLVLTYTVTVDAAATPGATLTNSAVVNRFFSKVATDPTQRRQYAATPAATASVIVGLNISGFVYHDLQPNNTRNIGEDWTGSGEPTVFINLLQGGVVISSVTVAPGTGAYSFPNLAAGNYDVILTDSAVNTVVARPLNWPLQNPATGIRTYTLTNANFTDQNFGLYQGSLVAPIITKAKSGDTLPLFAPATGFRIGDLVTYTIDVQPQEGVFTAFAVIDALPAGLAFFETVSIAQVSGPARFTFTTPTGVDAPAAAATGTVTWTFGAFTNAALGMADNILRLTYRARIVDASGLAVSAAAPAATSVNATNSAALSYTNSIPAVVTAGPATAAISVAQPRLLLAKTRLTPAATNLVEPGANASFRLTVTNNGAGPAYNVALEDVLPVGLRLTQPTVLAATLNGLDILATFPLPAYVIGTGTWSATLGDTQILLPGQTLIVDYQVTVDTTATRGTSVTNSATIPSYASKASADATDRRIYAPVGPSTQTLNIAARITGFVYHQLNYNGVKDPSEDWTSGVSVFVNLVPNSAISLPGFSAPANVVLRSVNVTAGAGDYTFPDVPAGDYRIILTNTAVATAVSGPAGWTLDTPATGALNPIVVSNANYIDQNFGLFLPRALSGFVYNDIIPNSVKDGFEDWLLGPTVFVNLIRTSNNTVATSFTVNPGTGAYNFSNIPPGPYRVIVTNSAGANTPIAPPGWIFRAPATGSLPVTLALVDLANQNIGLFRGRTARGVVFRDTGEAGTPNDGVRQGSEPGLGNVRVRLLDASFSVLDTAFTDGAGNFLLRIPAATANGDTLYIEEFNPPAHLSTGARPGSAGGTYDRAADRITFTFPDDDVTGIAFGDVPENALISDGAQTILPGATAYYRHQYIAGTGGTVIFTTANTATPSLPWTQVIVRDLNCNGQADPTEPIINGVALTVVAGEEICLVLKDNSPPGAPFGALNTTVITATFTYVNASPALPADARTRQDITTIGATSSAGLQLGKTVDKTIARPGEEITYTVTYTNVGAEELTTLFIDDRTPNYTVFVSATANVLPTGLTAVNITAPNVGEAGSIRWTFTGSLPPGGTGFVVFTTRVQQ